MLKPSRGSVAVAGLGLAVAGTDLEPRRGHAVVLQDTDFWFNKSPENRWFVVGFLWDL